MQEENLGESERARSEILVPGQAGTSDGEGQIMQGTVSTDRGSSGSVTSNQQSDLLTMIRNSLQEDRKVKELGEKTEILEKLRVHTVKISEQLTKQFRTEVEKLSESILQGIEA
jgi:hypothetical protein